MMKKHLKQSLPVMAERALKEAVRDVIKENIKAGLPLVVWKNGKVVKIPPNKLKKTGS